MAAVIPVSPKGKDSNAGTAESLLASPHAARDKGRQLVARGLTEPVDMSRGSVLNGIT